LFEQGVHFVLISKEECGSREPALADADREQALRLIEPENIFVCGVVTHVDGRARTKCGLQLLESDSLVPCICGQEACDHLPGKYTHSDGQTVDTIINGLARILLTRRLSIMDRQRIALVFDLDPLHPAETFRHLGLELRHDMFEASHV